MAMGFALENGLGFCQVGERLVFLDLRRDRYFCLSAVQEAGFLSLLDDDGRACSEADLAHLQSLGLGTVVPGAARPRACAEPRATRTIDEAMPARASPPSFATRAHVHLHLSWTRACVRLMPLHRILSVLDLARSGLALSPDMTGRAAPVVTAFQQASRFTASDGDCLIRSVSLARFLIAAQVSATLFFGVRLDPFAAHCWVQIGDMLVCDRLDTIRPYTPIMAI